ncbi:MAG: transcriptional regulator, partial [Chloroflexi bacterium]|nr:transcriptional regulator [Chloroflexota bacterium]
MTTQQSTQTFDEAKAEEFGNQLIGTYMGACRTLIVDLGHRSGLWESLAQGPATSVELADRSGL